MILPDVNLLLYAQITAFPQHARARRWWEGLMNGAEEVGVCAPALFGFVRIASNPRALDRPLRVEDALARVEAWCARPHVHFLQPGPRHLEIAFRLLRHVGAGANLTTDAQLAACAIEHQAELQRHRLRPFPPAALGEPDRMKASPR